MNVLRFLWNWFLVMVSIACVSMGILALASQ